MQTNDSDERPAEITEFLGLVKAMRENQKAYFKSGGGLETCKRLERDVDKCLKRLLDRQKELW